MQWGKIKTLFILSFLILNIYLLVQLLEKQEDADKDILERSESTIEEQLKEDQIVIPELPEEQAKEPYISVKEKVFEEEDFHKYDGFKDQRTVIVDKTLVVSAFKKPKKFPSDASKETIDNFAKKNFAFPDDYVYWNWNKEANVLIFFQVKNDRPVYYNQNGMIVIYLNDDDEMEFYTQTMLGEEDARQDKSSLIKPIKAIEILYNANELWTGEEITKVDIGFHTRAPKPSGVEVFVPEWKVTVNDERDYFVNAIEGWVFSNEEIDFIETTLTYHIERIESIVDHKEIRKKTLKILKDKLSEIDRGD